MKIVHVVEPFSSGIITFIINLTRQLSNHEHTVVHGRRTSSDSIESVRSRFSPDTNFVLWPHAGRRVHPLYDALALISLCKILRTSEFDVIHLHSSKAGVLGRLACFFLMTNRVVYTPNSVGFSRTDISPVKRLLFKGFEKFAGFLPCRVIACGQSEQELLNQIGVRSISINNGITIGDEPNKLVEIPLTVGFSGLISPQKNPSLFRSIAANYQNEHDIAFLWVGDGVLKDRLTASNIIITGWLKSEEEVKSKVNGIHIFLSTASWEGQSFAVLEAMNAGTCLLLYNCPGNRDLVTEGVNGFLFDTPEEAIEKINMLRGNVPLIKDMGHQSYLLARTKHDIEKTAALYENEYQRIVKNG